ncbi:ABC transporter type 1, transmembrane domain-containing protein [Podospora appendiculata]|uniref:ABC transporter type 1, transmembrane domain-containing protein n=1 Tax=Podospora appendiculata TaxID=314037 RepID=A0AAE0XIS7_9PEZI|nr:ABC transporter type 1, transmembrane domain-containing protein [Podospora appendiculata]
MSRLILPRIARLSLVSAIIVFFFFCLFPIDRTIPWALSLVFLVVFPWRLDELKSKPIKVRDSWRGRAKLVLGLVLSCTQLITGPRGINSVLPESPPVASLCLVWLSQVEHKRSVRPSSLVVLYLLPSALYDSLQLMHLTSPSTRWLVEDHSIQLGVVLALKAVLLGVECLSKQPVLLDSWRSSTPEETSGILGRAFVWWINSVLVAGYRKVLVNERLPAIDSKLSSGTLRAKILHTWLQNDSPSLPLVLVKCFLWPFLSLTVPRLCLLGFRYSQPLLISRAIVFVKSTNTAQDDGYYVILEAIFVYVGLALSARAYQHRLNRLQVMIRGALVSLVHESSLVAPSQAYDDGKAVALVTTDVSALENAGRMFHETWAQVVEVVVGTVLLARKVGWLWPVPHIIIIVCSQISRYVANNLKSRQTEWNVATQKRISMTSNMLGSIKSIKMLGIQDAVQEYILELRQGEVGKARNVRWMMFIYNASANALGMFAPVITIVLFAIIAMLNGKTLDTETAFATIAVLALVTHSANMVMTIIPRAVAAWPSFQRIESHLQLADLDGETSLTRHDDDSMPAILVKNLSVFGESSDKKILDNIDLEISQGMIVACSGPVGAGKTTLARAILGEHLQMTGVVTVSTRRVAYCAQTPWLPNETIKQVVCGPVVGPDTDEIWYKTVTEACCLDQDLSVLPRGDDTAVGDKGTSLSGGQRQRVALARAVFQRCKLVILDDTFSALDGRTEDQVSQNLLGPEGLFRKQGTTVFWITNSTQHLHLADHVIILDCCIKEQGHWSQLKTDEQPITKLIHDDHDDSSIAYETNDQAKKSGELGTTQIKAKADSDDLKRAGGDLSLYGYYFTSAGIKNVMFMLACTALYSFFITFPQYWMKWWTQDAEEDGKHTIFYAVGYAALNLMAWISTNGIMWSTILLVAPTSGMALHGRLLETVMRAPLFYFATTGTGVILNHFSQDIQLVDKQLASAVSNLGVQVFKLAMQASLLFAVQPLMTATLPFCAAIVYVVQKVYLQTSRQLRLIELESRSAVSTSLMETVQGAETIRAFGWHSEMAAENTASLDLSQRPFYLLFCLQRWLNIVLDLLVAGVAVGTIAVSVLLKGTMTGGQVGVALSMILVANSTLLRLVESWTNLEISLGAISRLKTVEEYTPQEEKLDQQDSAPVANWPSSDKLELRNFSVSYSENGTLALRNLNLKVSPGQTTVVCGRTGSGKSSLLLSLLRLLNIRSGAVLIDGVDISQVPLSMIRQRCFITVSQDPFFLPGASLRFNLDPSATISDQDIYQILESIGLWALLSTEKRTLPGTAKGKGIQGSSDSSSSSGSGRTSLYTPLLGDHRRPQSHDKAASSILDKPLSSLSALSGGQTQLLALARGLVQARVISRINSQTSVYSSFESTRHVSPTPIVLLDEVTSSLDAATEAAVYDIIQEEFINNKYTVIMVTHKLGAFQASQKRRRQQGRSDGGDVVMVWMRNGQVERSDESVD